MHANQDADLRAYYISKLQRPRHCLFQLVHVYKDLLLQSVKSSEGDEFIDLRPVLFHGRGMRSIFKLPPIKHNFPHLLGFVFETFLHRCRLCVPFIFSVSVPNVAPTEVYFA